MSYKIPPDKKEDKFEVVQEKKLESGLTTRKTGTIKKVIDPEELDEIQMSIYKESAVDKLKTVIQGKFMSESKINKKQDVLKKKLTNLRNEIELKKRRLITKKLKFNHLKIEATKPQSNVQVELTKEHISTPRPFTDSVGTK